MTAGRDREAWPQGLTAAWNFNFTLPGFAADLIDDGRVAGEDGDQRHDVHGERDKHVIEQPELRVLVGEAVVGALGEVGGFEGGEQLVDQELWWKEIK